ncbi:LLM class flavin-dependent oxidoreductase, partial [Nocardia gamkensis]|uniref:LLM class flavin-dependent oxidoreductase n=1 Tax=Nocardia gamkensis TaxID=352869 RepID=UPI0036F16634
MSAPSGMTFGSFVAPYADPRLNSALSIQQVLDYVEAMDRLGYAQAWFGEHHSGGWENIPSPEIMIGAAAQRTRSITLGTGVISLPYHHPLMVADRMVFLDHLTRGRVNIGIGPGAFPRDSEMMGMDYGTLRPRMEEALNAILHLLDKEEPLDEKTDWYEMHGAVLNQRSYTQPRVPITVAATFSPSGPRLAGRHGLELLSLGGTSQKSFEILGNTWEVIEYEAARYGQTVDRSRWKIVFQIHVSDMMFPRFRGVGILDFRPRVGWMVASFRTRWGCA